MTNINFKNVNNILVQISTELGLPSPMHISEKDIKAEKYAHFMIEASSESDEVEFSGQIEQKLGQHFLHPEVIPTERSGNLFELDISFNVEDVVAAMPN